MTGTISNPMETVIFPAGELNEMPAPAHLAHQPEFAELVRGSEQAFLAQFTPLVSRQSVTLDLAPVRRIDAAGIAALISLYSSAHRAGFCFAVANPAPHVAEILALVGLDRILLSQPAVWNAHSLECSAA